MVGELEGFHVAEIMVVYPSNITQLLGDRRQEVTKRRWVVPWATTNRLYVYVYGHFIYKGESFVLVRFGSEGHWLANKTKVLVTNQYRSFHMFLGFQMQHKLRTFLQCSLYSRTPANTFLVNILLHQFGRTFCLISAGHIPTFLANEVHVVLVIGKQTMSFWTARAKDAHIDGASEHLPEGEPMNTCEHKITQFNAHNYFHKLSYLHKTI